MTEEDFKALRNWLVDHGYYGGNHDVAEALEQPKGLDEEIDACWQNWLSPSNQKEVEGVLPKTEFAMYARHFYELGCRRTAEMYDDIEYNRQMAEEKQPVGGLDEEIAAWIPSHIKCEKDPHLRDVIIKWAGFVARHFAEWGRKQVLQEIYDGKVKPVDKITAAWLDDEQNT